MALTHWRPVCPDCGYSLRGLTETRCPECGERLPSASHTFRRWAVQRLPWDRARRGEVAQAYLATMLPVLVLPWRAGRRVALPDRWRRSAGWAIAHLSLALITATLLGNHRYFVSWFYDRLHPSAFHHPALLFLEEAPRNRASIWLAQSLVAWMIALTVFPALGILLSLGIPGRHRVAKLAGAKWSLYVSPVLLVALAGWHGYYFAFPQTMQVSMPVSFVYRLPAPPIPPWVLACVYGAWWAAGLAANPYKRSRWTRSFPVFALLYIGTWLALTQWLFDCGPLVALL